MLASTQSAVCGVLGRWRAAGSVTASLYCRLEVCWFGLSIVFSSLLSGKEIKMELDVRCHNTQQPWMFNPNVLTHKSVLCFCELGLFGDAAIFCGEVIINTFSWPVSTYQAMVAGSWPASCCPLHWCCCHCCCHLVVLLPSPSYIHRRTGTGCTVSSVRWQNYWMYQRSESWTARATFCSCLPGQRRIILDKK